MSRTAVIIGGGLGGLITGAILAREGLDVTVLEKNLIIGGGLQSFVRFGEVFDTGMHIIGGMQQNGNVRRICEYLGIWDRVHVADVDPAEIDDVYFAEDGRTYRISQGREAFVDTLAGYFPDQRSNLEAYVDAMYRVTEEVDLFYLRPSSDDMRVHSDDFMMSADTFIAKYITESHLQSIVAYMNPLYGGRGGKTPAYIHSLISVLYLNGPSRFAGGSVLFANTLRDFITGQGGRVIAGDPVSLVHSADRRIEYVQTEKGLRYTADYYISAVHPCTLFELMDNPSDLPKPYRQRLQELPNAYSAFTLNIRLKPDTFRYFNRTVYYMTTYDGMWKFGEGEWPRGFLFMTPPEISQGEYARKMIVTAPMQWKEVEKWENTSVGHRGEEYEAWKRSCADKLLDCLEKVCPGFRDCIEDINTASPLTIRDFYGVKEGSMCGFSKDCNNILMSQVPVVTKIHNLYLTGQNCNLHGFCGVALTAISTSEAIFGRNYIVNRINRFDDIRPYQGDEFLEAARRLAGYPAFVKAFSWVFPERSAESLKAGVLAVRCQKDFDDFMFAAIERIKDRTITEYSCSGLEDVGADETCLYLSNHRDIVMDAALLLCSQYAGGVKIPQVSFGSNLMQKGFVTDLGKMVRMFRVERSGSDPRQDYNFSNHLSDYINHTILQRAESVWIAQRNGRTKDGCDRTDNAILRMFAMHGPDNLVEALSRLNIRPVSVSYEWEPCDMLKALELYTADGGVYVKKPGEDINSIITGIQGSKGRTHIEVCAPLTAADLAPFAAMPARRFFAEAAGIIDRRICMAYRLYPNNYIACDLLSGCDEFCACYTAGQKEAFLRHLERLDAIPVDNPDRLRRIFLGIYANPVHSRKHFETR